MQFPPEHYSQVRKIAWVQTKEYCGEAKILLLIW